MPDKAEKDIAGHPEDNKKKPARKKGLLASVLEWIAQGNERAIRQGKFCGP